LRLPDARSALSPLRLRSVLGERGVTADDPFTAELTARLVEEAHRSRDALRLTDLTWPVPDPDNDGLPHPMTLNLICLKI
jgi:hypothetical protein